MSDFLSIFTDNWPGRIIGVIFLIIIFSFVYHIWFISTHECLQSHEEIQYQLPPNVVVGGGKYGGGVGIPIGNARPVQVTVCDKYE